LHQRLVRQGDLRLAVRRGHREAARRLCQGDRPGQAEGARRAGLAAPVGGLSDLCPARPVHPANGAQDQSQWSAADTVPGAVEFGEEMSRLRRLLLPLLGALGLAAGPPASAETVLRAVMHSDLKIIDPVWTTALISAHHGYLVYDTLFSLDETLRVKPQMVERWEVSPDQLTYSFTLRDGLEWHDGAKVTAADCVASLKRWGARDSSGQTLLSFVSELTAPDERTIRLVLREPFGLVIELLGK